eukprot:CAMPEP_0171628170 /NCGR_PEP_ID=MMETSP0990-20121206/21262_1 /TAXON_ID=483369 /ORGANISM="non described non described, Strain CCMP2098" /LENGTH=421 /DNA_ID=CAMNT_0012196273 /DNA_START=22 /DNA_END=1287 /DNA_ORIENTATION=+
MTPFLAMLHFSSVSRAPPTSYAAGENEGDQTVLLVGDWGAPPSNEAFIETQRLVARGMETVASRFKHVSHVISLGDAFYMNGIANVDDPLFDASWRFNDVAPTIAKLEWLSVLGNHDCRGNVSALVSLGSHRNRHGYRLPARYYSKTILETTFAFLDTCSLVCGGDWSAFEPPDVLAAVQEVLKSPTKDVIDEARRRFPASPLLPFGMNGTLARAGECSKLPPDSKPDPAAQLDWLDYVITNHEARNTKKQEKLEKVVDELTPPSPMVVIGHSPLFSAGVPLQGHGDYPQLISRLHNRFSRSSVALYFSGDEHSMQVVERDSTRYVVSGSGGGLDLHLLRPDAGTYQGLRFAESSLGFSSLTRLGATGDLVLTLHRVKPALPTTGRLSGRLGNFWFGGQASATLPVVDIVHTKLIRDESRR